MQWTHWLISENHCEEITAQADEGTQAHRLQASGVVEEGVMARYRKKPVEIEAMQWDGTLARAEAIMEWSGGEEKTPLGFDVVSEPIDFAWIETLEGEMTVRIDDWVIRGVAGEFYPCKPDIFKQTYEPVN